MPAVLLREFSRAAAPDAHRVAGSNAMKRQVSVFISSVFISSIIKLLREVYPMRVSNPGEHPLSGVTTAPLCQLCFAEPLI